MRKQGKGIGRNSSARSTRLTWLIVVVAVFALGATAAVSLRTGQAKDSAARQNNKNLHEAAQQVPLNTQTGQVRPLTQEEAQRLAAGIKELVSQSTDGLKTVKHADGSVSMDLQGRFQSFAVARQNEDGGVTQSCVDNPQAAAAFFGIDPAMVGVQRNAASKSSATEKGEIR